MSVAAECSSSIAPSSNASIVSLDEDQHPIGSQPRGTKRTAVGVAKNNEPAKKMVEDAADRASRKRKPGYTRILLKKIGFFPDKHIELAPGGNFEGGKIGY